MARYLALAAKKRNGRETVAVVQTVGSWLAGRLILQMSSSSRPRARRRLTYSSRSRSRSRVMSVPVVRVGRTLGYARRDRYTPQQVYCYRQTVSSLATIGGAPAGWVAGTTTNDPYVLGASAGVPGTAAFVSGAMAFQLADLNQVTTFTALYDQYRFDKVVVEFMPVFSENGQSGGLSAGDLYVVADYDDANALADLNAFRQRADVKMVPSWKGVTKNIKPRVALAAYGGAFTAFANQAHQWLDCASTGIQHYGIKYAIANQGNNTAIPRWTVKISYYLSFRNVL